MRNFFTAFLCCFIIGQAIPRVNSWKSKPSPDHAGIDDEIRSFEVMYRLDATANRIFFDKPVSIGFSSIKTKSKSEAVVGLCTYGANFREIDVDRNYWDKSTWITRRTLIYHEMIHCFCGRDHTFKGGTYPEADVMMKKKKNTAPYLMQPGYMADGCPMSIMYPYVLKDDCVSKHWDIYDKEMFEDCKPY